MPKIDAQLLRADYNHLKRNLRKIEKSLTAIRLCELLGISRKTWYNRLKKPENLTYGELRAISRVSGVDFDILVSGEVKLI